MAKWLRDKRQDDVKSNTLKARQHDRNYSVEDDTEVSLASESVRTILKAIPPKLMGERSLEFKSYPRSLLYWEQHIRHERESMVQLYQNATDEKNQEQLYEKLQQIYTHIDEPDGMSGISTMLPALDLDQQVLEYRKAGKWTAVQNWYELLVDTCPGKVNVQVDLIGALSESGHHEALLQRVDGLMATSKESHTRLLPHAVEASWMTGNWDALSKYLSFSTDRTEMNFDIQLGIAFSELRNGDMDAFKERIEGAREVVAGMMTEPSTSSIRQCHHLLVQLHALSELQLIGEEKNSEIERLKIDHTHDLEKNTEWKEKTFASRLNLMGTYSSDKLYILSVRRAALDLVKYVNQ